jgi:hypothetical protein
MAWSGNILSAASGLAVGVVLRKKKGRKKRGGWLGHEEGNEIGPSEGELGCVKEKKAGGLREENHRPGEGSG